jgi:hypothetical protein
VRGSGTDAALRRISVDRTDTGFAIEAETDGGDTIRGTAEIGHEYTLPVYGRKWSGTFVTADVGRGRMAGFVNRWNPMDEGETR